MDEDVKKRERSPNFPIISLEMALARARQLYDREKKGLAALSVVAQHWSYSLKSSGFLQVIGALKSYGLLEDEGRGLERRVRLTEFALRILLDPRSDSPEKSSMIRQAALTPSVAQGILERFPEPPSSANLEHFLIFDLQFNPDSAKSAVKVFFENSVFANIYTVQEPNLSREVGDSVRGGLEITPATGAISTSQGIPMVLAAQGIPTMERIGGPDGPITIQFGSYPTWEVLDFLENYIKLRKSILKPGAHESQKESP